MVSSHMFFFYFSFVCNETEESHVNYNLKAKMEVKKRVRSSNFSETEKHILVDVISKHIDRVENKKTDTQTTEDKKKVWLKIEEEFNARSLHARSWSILKTKWENLKTDARKYHASNKMELLKTGGGKSNISTENKLLDKVKTLVSATVDGLQSLYDSDAEYNITVLYAPESAGNDSVNTSQYKETLLEISPGTGDVTSATSNVQTFDSIFNNTEIPEVTQLPEQTWAQWTPAKLRTPISEPLQHTYKSSSVLQAITEAAISEKKC